MWFAGGFHWMTVKGQRALPAEAPILTLAPHSSYFDAIPVTMTMASIVMKAESKDIPLWGSELHSLIFCYHCCDCDHKRNQISLEHFTKPVSPQHITYMKIIAQSLVINQIY